VQEQHSEPGLFSSVSVYEGVFVCAVTLELFAISC